MLAEAPAVEEGTPKKKVDIEELDESAGGGDD